MRTKRDEARDWHKVLQLAKKIAHGEDQYISQLLRFAKGRHDLALVEARREETSLMDPGQIDKAQMGGRDDE